MRIRTLLRTALAVGTTAAVGALGTDPSSDWYRSLSTPRWQPPPLAYPLVWTPLYADVAVTGAQALSVLALADRPTERRALVGALSLNLALNCGWNWVFFRAHRPGLAAVECAVLTVSSADLVRRVAAADPRSGAALAPYAVWCGFATALTAAIWRRNR